MKLITLDEVYTIWQECKNKSFKINRHPLIKLFFTSPVVLIPEYNTDNNGITYVSYTICTEYFYTFCEYAKLRGYKII